MTKQKKTTNIKTLKVMALTVGNGVRNVGKGACAVDYVVRWERQEINFGTSGKACFGRPNGQGQPSDHQKVGGNFFTLEKQENSAL